MVIVEVNMMNYVELRLKDGFLELTEDYGDGNLHTEKIPVGRTNEILITQEAKRRAEQHKPCQFLKIGLAGDELERVELR